MFYYEQEVAPHYELHIVSHWINNFEIIVMHSLLFHNGKVWTKVYHALLYQRLWEVQEHTYDKLSIFQACFSLSVSTINAM